MGYAVSGYYTLYLYKGVCWWCNTPAHRFGGDLHNLSDLAQINHIEGGEHNGNKTFFVQKNIE